MNRAVYGLIAVAAAAAVIFAIFFFAPQDETVTPPDETPHSVSFYFYDTYENDQTSGLLSENRHLANGYWVRGYGETKSECFGDACGLLGIDAETDEDGLVSLNGVEDGNFCVVGWTGNAWNPAVSLTSHESYAVRYMAVGHGRWMNGTSGEPPVPHDTPDDILWYAGSVPEDGVYVYFYDNYESDEDSEQQYPSPSDLNSFIADGFWVCVSGNDAGTAVRNACAEAFGTNAICTFDPLGRPLNIEGTGVLWLMIWTDDKWVECTADTYVQNGTSIAVGRGYSADGGAPAPWEDPGSRTWCISPNAYEAVQ